MEKEKLLNFVNEKIEILNDKIVKLAQLIEIEPNKTKNSIRQNILHDSAVEVNVYNKVREALMCNSDLVETTLELLIKESEEKITELAVKIELEKANRPEDDAELTDLKGQLHDHAITRNTCMVIGEQIKSGITDEESTSAAI